MSRENNAMAYIAEITHLLPIKDADSIEKAIINAGWPVVVKKDEFKVGDLVIYFELDSWIPHELAPFLSKGKEPKEYNKVKGERLRTVKLRGQKSQGLVLDLETAYVRGLLFDDIEKGFQVGNLLGIQKWEEPEKFSTGLTKGNFPIYVPKTDAERIQNLSSELQDWVNNNYTFEVTEKLHGTSFTAIWEDNNFHVCSRNLDLQEGDNTYWNIANTNSLLDKFKTLGAGNLAIQGEIIGPGICGNQYTLEKPHLFIFNIYDIDKKTYLEAGERLPLVEDFGLHSVPIIDAFHKIINTPTIESLLEFADGKSQINGSQREGLVFKCYEDPSIQFKVVSDSWLMNEK